MTEYHRILPLTVLLLALVQPAASQTGQGALVLRARTAAGDEIAAVGALRSEDGMAVRVASGGRQTLDAGRYALRVGVETRNDSLYRPVAKEVEVVAGEDTVVEVVVDEPPSVSARFLENGEERGDGPYFDGQVYVYQDGRQVFHFRWNERVYLDEGEYSFHSNPNPENEDLTVRESFAAGDHKVVTFEMVHTVHAIVKVVAEGYGLDFRESYELWQDGERVKPVHWVDGVWARPGVYELRLTDKLNRDVREQVVLEPRREHDFRIEIPAGTLTVVYQKADGSRAEDDRFALARVVPDDPEATRRTTMFFLSGQPIPLTPGRYRVEGWERLGTFEPVEVDVAAGEEVEVVLRDQG